MKHFFCLLFLVLICLRPVAVQAQPSGSDSLGQKLASIFAHIDKRQVPGGYRYEAGVRLAIRRHLRWLTRLDKGITIA